MTSTAHELGIPVGRWNALVRRARITQRQKLAALLVSSYADADGTDIHCGVDRLAADMDASYRTAQRYLAWLREVGLIELVQPGNRRKGLADEYRLILGPDVMEHIEVPNPTRYDALRSAIRDARGGAAGRLDQATTYVSSDQGHEKPAEGVDQRTTYVTPERPIRGQNEVDQRTNLCVLPPPLSTSPLISTSPTTTDEEVCTDVAVGGARKAAARVVEIRPGASEHPPYVAPPRKLSFAERNLAEAAARRARAKAEHQASKEAK